METRLDIHEEYGRCLTKLIMIFKEGDLSKYEETDDEETALLLGTYYLINNERERAEFFYKKITSTHFKDQISMISQFKDSLSIVNG